MADIAESVLREAEEKGKKFKSIEVEKNLELEIDEGNLLAVDQNPINTDDYRSDKEAFLQSLARDNTQVLINSIWKLPVERVEDVVLVKLPAPTTILPREKPVPTTKQPTKWEKYARLKGVNKTKKSRMTWDDKVKDWRPRWGYKRANDESKEWVLEVPQSADPFEDQFAKLNKAKKERVAKNELQRLRNIARAQKGKVPGVGLTPTEIPNKDQMAKALVVAKASTPSLGKFSETLRNEKLPKNMGKKRKFESNVGDIGKEKQRQLEIFGKIQNKKPKINMERAVNKHMAREDEQRKEGRKENPRKTQKKVKGVKNSGRKSGKSSKKKRR